MIDPDWFTIMRCLSGASLTDDELDRLSYVLGEESEVLPYLLLKTDAFHSWPKARQAMRAAVNAVIRTPQSAFIDSSPYNNSKRPALAKALRSRLSGTGEELPLPDRLISEFRVQSSDISHQPQDFIDCS